MEKEKLEFESESNVSSSDNHDDDNDTEQDLPTEEIFLIRASHFGRNICLNRKFFEK